MKNLKTYSLMSLRVKLKKSSVLKVASLTATPMTSGSIWYPSTYSNEQDEAITADNIGTY
jgi:hypothetical protein